MSRQPRWLSLDLISAIHAEQLRLFGGPEGLRDRGALESALGRPLNRYAYEGAGLAELAACYAFGIARNHAFVDGNKRTAFLAVVTFLGLNGVEFVVDDASAVSTFRDLAAGALTEGGLSRWVRDNWPAGTPLDMG